MVPLGADAIFADMSRESDENCATLAEKVREMDRSEVVKKNVTPTEASNDLSNNGSKVSVSTLRQDSQRPADAPLTMCGPLLFLSEEAEGRCPTWSSRCDCLRYFLPNTASCLWLIPCRRALPLPRYLRMSHYWRGGINPGSHE